MTENINSTNNGKLVPLIVHGEWASLQKWLGREQLGRLFLAVLNYGAGQEPDFSDDERLAMVWEMTIFPSLKSAREKYLDACKKNAAAGRKSAESRKRATTVNGRQHSLTGVNARQRASTNSNNNNNNKFKGGDVHVNSNIASDSNPACNPDHDSLPVGRPTLPMNFREWSDEQFLSSVDAAISGNPELAQHKDAFVDHYLRSLTPTGKALFRAQKSWNTAGRLRTWLKNEAMWSAERSGKQASQPVSQSASQPVQPPLEEIRGLQYWEIGNAKEVAK